MSTTDLMAPITVDAYLSDGTPCKITADTFHADRLNLTGAVVEEFIDGNGSPVLIIIEDGIGTKFLSDKDNAGVSLPALVFGRKHMVTYKSSDLFDVRMANFTTQKQLNTYK